MLRKLFLISSAVALVALPGLAQNKLNGTWKLNISKSDFGQMPPPTSETDTITVNGTQFTQKVRSETARGTSSYTRSCDINGQEEKLSPDNPRAHIGPVVIASIKCEKKDDGVVVTEGFDMRGDPSFDQSDSSADNPAPPANGGMAATPGAEAIIHTGDGAASDGPHPDFSGTWNLDIAKSNFGQGQPPASEVDTITENGNSMTVVTAQKGGMMGDMNTTEKFTTDGKPSTWTGMGDSKVTGTANWDGDKLVVNAKTSFQGSDVNLKETYSLSADGKTLTKTLHAETGMGNFDSTSVYDKQ